jgi:hypothetical protein
MPRKHKSREAAQVTNLRQFRVISIDNTCHVLKTWHVSAKWTRPPAGGSRQICKEDIFVLLCFSGEKDKQ